MRKVLLPVFVVLMLLVALFGSTKSVQAAGVEVLKPAGEGDHWNTGTEIAVDLSLFPAPPDWQLFGKAVVIDEPEKICHPFDKGRYGWTGAIYQLIDGQWKKLVTEVGWVPSDEGKYTACANATTAGTYGLFAYYTEPEEEKSCSKVTANWYMEYFDAADYPELYPGLEGIYLDAYVPNIPVGSPVLYTILIPDGNLSADLSGLTQSYLYNGHSMWADFVDSSPITWEGNWTITVRITAAGCFKDVTLSNLAD